MRYIFFMNSRYILIKKNQNTRTDIKKDAASILNASPYNEYS